MIKNFVFFNTKFFGKSFFGQPPEMLLAHSQDKSLIPYGKT